MIRENVQQILKELPEGVLLSAAAKTRTADEVSEAIAAGVHIVGENYVQEAETVFHAVRGKVPFHFFGHLQRNKVKKAVALFDMIETVDSVKLALEIDKRCAAINKTMQMLIEVNSGREPQKNGALPEKVEPLVREISILPNVKIMGLMTMGPYFGSPEDFRPYFKETKHCFEQIKSLKIPNVEMRYLSMGMTNSYRTAIEEGANIIRLGTKIFGERQK